MQKLELCSFLLLAHKDSVVRRHFDCCVLLVSFAQLRINAEF